MTRGTDWLALHDGAGESIRDGRARAGSECGATSPWPGGSRCWWLSHHLERHSWELATADLRAIVDRQAAKLSHLSDPSDNMQSHAEAPMHPTPEHRRAAERAIPYVNKAADLLRDAAGEPGLHPAVARLIASVAEHAATWASLLPHMTGAQPSEPTTKKPKKGRTT